MVNSSLRPNARARHCRQIETAIDDVIDLDAVVDEAYRDVETAIARVCAAERARDAASRTLERLIAISERLV